MRTSRLRTSGSPGTHGTGGVPIPGVVTAVWWPWGQVYVAAFAVSAYASTYYRAGSKPFNPVLGETYECVRPDRGFRFISEQVSHHPPISACHAESDNFVFWQGECSGGHEVEEQILGQIPGDRPRGHRQCPIAQVRPQHPPSPTPCPPLALRAHPRARRCPQDRGPLRVEQGDHVHPQRAERAPLDRALRGGADPKHP
ncbi:hypothetical protein IHE44_0010351 [Lamprotornis superbus]|uniref:Oxysterol-binding protein n=1 Tax=Lamprotornis superbus TaxID=245042 RepID=A0A835TNZ4_9PASS|nr:hypothetical protein IHE44_0010351 [Lamprotornis superbus]